MTRYHIGKNGEPRICKAQPGKCPLGGEHYTTINAAYQAAEKLARQATLNSLEQTFEEDYKKAAEDRQAFKELPPHSIDHQGYYQAWYDHMPDQADGPEALKAWQKVEPQPKKWEETIKDITQRANKRWIEIIKRIDPIEYCNDLEQYLPGDHAHIDDQEYSRWEALNLDHDLWQLDRYYLSDEPDEHDYNSKEEYYAARDAYETVIDAINHKDYKTIRDLVVSNPSYDYSKLTHDQKRDIDNLNLLIDHGDDKVFPDDYCYSILEVDDELKWEGFPYDYDVSHDKVLMPTDQQVNDWIEDQLKSPNSINLF